MPESPRFEENISQAAKEWFENSNFADLEAIAAELRPLTSLDLGNEADPPTIDPASARRHIERSRKWALEKFCQRPPEEEEA